MVAIVYKEAIWGWVLVDPHMVAKSSSRLHRRANSAT